MNGGLNQRKKNNGSDESDHGRNKSWSIYIYYIYGSKTNVPCCMGSGHGYIMNGFRINVITYESIQIVNNGIHCELMGFIMGL